MKLTKLMLSALAATVALAACNKDGISPDVPGSVKSIEISITNSLFTKGDGGGAIPGDKSVTLNNLRIYLTDDNYSQFYEAKAADGTTDATMYWDSDISSVVGQKISFHYVNASVTKVIAVGNMGETAYTDINALKSATLQVTDQQDQANLALYGEGKVSASNTTHADGEILNNVYTASVALKPRISRFEVAGFRVKFNDEPKYNEVKVSQIALDDYMPSTTFYTGVETGTLVDGVTTAQLGTTNSSEVYSWLAGNNSSSVWWYDLYNDVTLTPTAPVVDVNQRAYHVFAGTQIPQFVLHLIVDGVPAYVYTKTFVDKNNEVIGEIEEGTIYRMSAEGTVSGSDGAIEIPEDKIDQMDRCLDITVTVEPWVVTLVTPEF